MVSISTSGKTKTPVLGNWELQINRTTRFPDNVKGKLLADFRDLKAGEWVYYNDVEQANFKKTEDNQIPKPPDIVLSNGLNVKLIGAGAVGYFVTSEEMEQLRTIYEITDEYEE